MISVKKDKHSFWLTDPWWYMFVQKLNKKSEHLCVSNHWSSIIFLAVDQPLLVVTLGDHYLMFLTALGKTNYLWRSNNPPKIVFSSQPSHPSSHLLNEIPKIDTLTFSQQEFGPKFVGCFTQNPRALNFRFQLFGFRVLRIPLEPRPLRLLHLVLHSGKLT